MLILYGAKAFRPELKGLIRDIRVNWTLEELGLPYERVTLDARGKKENFSPEYLKLNPFGKVPTLKDGDSVIFESAAICQYIARKKGNLLPAYGTQEWDLCQQWIFCAVTNIEPQAGRILAADYFMEKDAVSKKVREMAVSVLERFLPVFNTLFSNQEYLLKSGFSVADILMASSLSSASHSEVYDPYPSVKKYLDRLFSRPAYKIAFEKNGI